MPFTGILGTVYSQLGNIELAATTSSTTTTVTCLPCVETDSIAKTLSAATVIGGACVSPQINAPASSQAISYATPAESQQSGLGTISLVTSLTRAVEFGLVSPSMSVQVTALSSTVTSNQLSIAGVSQATSFTTTPNQRSNSAATSLTVTPSSSSAISSQLSIAAPSNVACLAVSVESVSTTPGATAVGGTIVTSASTFQQHNTGPVSGALSGITTQTALSSTSLGYFTLTAIGLSAPVNSLSSVVSERVFVTETTQAALQQMIAPASVINASTVMASVQSSSDSLPLSVNIHALAKPSNQLQVAVPASILTGVNIVAALACSSQMSVTQASRPYGPPQVFGGGVYLPGAFGGGVYLPPSSGTGGM